MKMKAFKVGEITDQLWCGEFRTKCEFIRYMGLGLMLFNDLNFGCFRLAYYEVDEEGKMCLNGWISGKSISDIKVEIANQLLK